MVPTDPNAFRRTLGNRIRRWRLRGQMSQAELAEATGVTQATLSHYETGKRDVTVSTLVRIAEELEVTLEDLTGSVPRVKGGGSSRRSAGKATRTAGRTRES